MSHTRGGKTCRDERSDDESEYNKKWASMRRRGAPFNELLAAQCKEMKSTIKSLQSEIWMLKSSERKTKRQLRINYDWDGENANLSDKVSNWVKTYLFPRYKFLKLDGISQKT